MCRLFDVLGEHCEDLQYPERAPVFYTITLVFQLLIALAVYALLIFGISYSYSYTYGDIGLENCGALYVCAMVSYTIFLVLILIYSICEVASQGLLITWYVICIYSVVCLFSTLYYTTGSSLDAFKNVAFKNWRVDIEYIVFEAKNNCNGLEAMKDPTNNKCDDIYTNKLNERLNFLTIISITTGVLIFVALCIYAVPETCYRISKCLKR